MGFFTLILLLISYSYPLHNLLVCSFQIIPFVCKSFVLQIIPQLGFFWGGALCWVLVAVQVFLQLWRAGAPLQLQAQASRCSGVSCCRAWALDHMSFSSCSSQAIEYRLNACGALAQLSCSTACGIFSDQGSNLCLLHWQVDSLPLSLQGSHPVSLLILFKGIFFGLYSNLQ